MLRPSVPELVAGVADSLATGVVPDLPPGGARDELVAAVHLLRRIARAVPLLVPYLHDDIADLAATLDRVAPRPDGAPRSPTVGSGVPGGELQRLTTVNLALREELASVAGAERLDADTEAVVVAALRRLAEREAALGLSPWDRGNG